MKRRNPGIDFGVGFYRFIAVQRGIFDGDGKELSFQKYVRAHILSFAWWFTSAASDVLRRRVSGLEGPYRFPCESDSSRPIPKVNNAHDRAVKASKVAPFRLYDLRHTWATRAAMSGIDLVFPPRDSFPKTRGQRSSRQRRAYLPPRFTTM